MLDLSVIICTHNPRGDYLRRALEALRNQSLPISQWELLIIDNASKEPLATGLDISWHPNSRHIFEGKLGVTHARVRGMCEMSSNLLVFVDDDNVLDPNYLAEAVKLSRAWPRLGVWGSGFMSPEFECEPPGRLRDLLPWLALRNASIARWSNVYPCTEATPWGAGMCVRANVAAAFCDMSEKSSIQMLSRTGKSLLSCEDVEIGYVACSMDFGMAIFPQLKLIHLISKDRVTEDYLLRVMEGTSTSEYLLAYKWQGIFPPKPFTILGLLALMVNALVRRGIQRRMYFAHKRAARKALQIIKATLPKT